MNSTITHLELTNNITAREEVTARARIAYQNLIRFLKKLKCFKCNEIDDELFLFLAMDVPNLLSIETFHFNVLRIPQRMVFPRIKKLPVSRRFSNANWQLQICTACEESNEINLKTFKK